MINGKFKVICRFKIAYKKYYSKKDYKRIFYYICYPKLKFINNPVVVKKLV
jgi:hypothetical protein